MVVQQRKIQLEDIFWYELYAVTSSLIDEYGSLHKGNKASLANRLRIKDMTGEITDTIIIDAMQSLYHVTWPHWGTASDLAEITKSQ